MFPIRPLVLPALTREMARIEDRVRAFGSHLWCNPNARMSGYLARAAMMASDTLRGASA